MRKLAATFFGAAVCVATVALWIGLKSHGDDSRAAASPAPSASKQQSLNVSEAASIAPHALDSSGSAHRGFPTNDGYSELQAGVLFEKYRAAASQGDADAQFVLATALAECRRVPKSNEDLVGLAQRGVDPQIIESVRSRVQRCAPLFDLVSDVDAEYERWYAAARSANHPLIVVKQSAPIEEKRRSLMKAISAEYPESFMYADAFAEAARFYATYPEVLDSNRQEAWILLYCAASYNCNSDAERESLSTKYPLPQYREIAAIETSLRDAFERQEWSALGF